MSRPATASPALAQPDSAVVPADAVLAAQPKDPVVSVVMPTYNRLPQLRIALDALAAQTLPWEQFEVVIVSDGSTDGTDDYLRSGTTPVPVVYARQANAGPAAARNLGVQMSSGRLIVFLDDDVVPAPDLLSRHIAAHGDAPNTVVIGPMLTDPAFDYRPWVAWEQSMLYKQYDALQKGTWPAGYQQFYTGNASMTRAQFIASGGFDVSFRRAEDIELAYRLHQIGSSFVFEPAAEVFHHADRSFSSWLATAASYGRNEMIFARRVGEGWRVDTVAWTFRQRNVLSRVFVLAFVTRPRLAAAVTSAGGRVARVISTLGARRLAQAMFSAIYGLAWYVAAGEEFGDPRGFRHVLVTATDDDDDDGDHHHDDHHHDDHHHDGEGS